MPKFQRRHYRTIAEVLREVREDSDTLFTSAEVFKMIGAFATAFQQDNPRFKIATFAVACGVDSASIPQTRKRA